MNLIVLGASRGIGYQVVTQALEAGHCVTAIVRRPDAITLTHPNLKIVVGDALKLDTFQNAVAGQDAVICTVGDNSTKPMTFFSDTMKNIITAMESQHVNRLMCISASALETGPGQNFLLRRILVPMIQRFLKEPYIDLRRMEKLVENTGLDWTIIRPSRLTDKPKKGNYKIGLNKFMSSFSISRADVADYIVKHLTDQTSYRARVELEY